MSVTDANTNPIGITYCEIEPKVNNLVSNLYDIGATDSDIFAYFINKDNLIEAMQSITEANEWEFMQRGYMYDTNNRKRIEECYSKRNTYELHSGSSYGFLMRKMQIIAQLGFDAFATKTIEHMRNAIENRNRKP